MRSCWLALIALVACLGMAPLGVAPLGVAPAAAAGRPASRSPGDTSRSAGAPSPLADVETWRLPNGVRVWHKYVAGEPRAAMSVVVPYGSDHDPPGREQLAHFLEHVQFADRDGRTEAQLNREIDALGGVADGHTLTDRTEYTLAIGAEHGAAGLAWLGRLVSPHPLDERVVASQREPIAIEVGARPRSTLARLGAAYLRPRRLRSEGFWKQEFGLEAADVGEYDPYASLWRITPADLRAFYDRYYVPARLTVIIAGGVPRDVARAAAERAFGGLAPRAAPPPGAPLRDPERERAETNWKTHAYTLYRESYKLFDVVATDRAMLVVLRDLLAKRLDDQLRYGERKAVYHPDVSLELRGTAALLTVSAQTSERELAFVRKAVRDELARLRDGTVHGAEFAADRDAVALRLRAAASSPTAVEVWGRGLFAAAPPFDAPMPDPVAVAEQLSPARLSGFMAPRFVERRRVVRVNHALPLPPVALLLLVLALGAAVAALVRRRILRPLDMRRIRYVARFRPGWLYGMALAGSALLAAALLLRLAAYAAERLTVGVLWRVDSLVVQWSAYAAMLALLVWGGVTALSYVPRKLLVLDDEITVKFLAYRSRPIAPGDVAELALLRFADVWLTRRLWCCVPLTLGVLRPGVYLRTRRGRAWYFATRDPRVAYEVLRARAAGGG